MKRRGFLSRILAALGVGAVVSVGKPSLSESTPIPGHVMPPRLGVEARLRSMIARDRAQGLEVNYFHTNRATLNELWKNLEAWPMAAVGGYTAYMFEGVEWCRCEEMMNGMILVSDVGLGRWKPVRLKSKSYVVDQELADLWGVPMGVDLNDL